METEWNGRPLDTHRVLGLAARNPDPGLVRTAYRERVRPWHPDLNPTALAAGLFLPLTWARDQLVLPGGTGWHEALGAGGNGPGLERERDIHMIAAAVARLAWYRTERDQDILALEAHADRICRALAGWVRREARHARTRTGRGIAPDHEQP